jgi:hypothetical protein
MIIDEESKYSNGRSDRDVHSKGMGGSKEKKDNCEEL